MDGGFGGLKVELGVSRLGRLERLEWLRFGF